MVISKAGPPCPGASLGAGRQAPSSLLPPSHVSRDRKPATGQVSWVSPGSCLPSGRGAVPRGECPLPPGPGQEGPWHGVGVVLQSTWSRRRGFQVWGCREGGLPPGMPAWLCALSWASPASSLPSLGLCCVGAVPWVWLWLCRCIFPSWAAAVPTTPRKGQVQAGGQGGEGHSLPGAEPGGLGTSWDEGEEQVLVRVGGLLGSSLHGSLNQGTPGPGGLPVLPAKPVPRSHIPLPGPAGLPSKAPAPSQVSGFT